MSERIELSAQEVKRLKIIQQVTDGVLRQHADFLRGVGVCMTVVGECSKRVSRLPLSLGTGGGIDNKK